MNNPILWRIACWVGLIVLTISPILLPKKKQIRIVSVLILLFVAYNQLMYGVRCAARNTPPPDDSILHSLVTYRDAWFDGKMAVQKKTDLYLVPLKALYISLAILALSPAITIKRKSPNHGLESTGAPPAAETPETHP